MKGTQSNIWMGWSGNCLSSLLVLEREARDSSFERICPVLFALVSWHTLLLWRVASGVCVYGVDPALYLCISCDEVRVLCGQHVQIQFVIGMFTTMMFICLLLFSCSWGWIRSRQQLFCSFFHDK